MILPVGGSTVDASDHGVVAYNSLSALLGLNGR